MRRLATVSLAALLLGTVGLASSGPLPDDQVKAAVIYKVMLFTQWQASAADPDRRVLCVRGNDGVAEALPMLGGRSLGDRALQVQPLTDDSYDGCDAVYVAGVSARRPLPESPSRRGLMTVVDCGVGLCESGAVLSLAVEDSRLVFSVDRRRAEQQGLEFSAQVLRLARPERSP